MGLGKQPVKAKGFHLLFSSWSPFPILPKAGHVWIVNEIQKSRSVLFWSSVQFFLWTPQCLLFWPLKIKSSNLAWFWRQQLSLYAHVGKQHCAVWDWCSITFQHWPCIAAFHIVLFNIICVLCLSLLILCSSDSSCYTTPSRLKKNSVCVKIFWRMHSSFDDESTACFYSLEILLLSPTIGG